MSNSMFRRVRGALVNARDAVDYEHAKLLAEDCTPREQLQLVDAFKAARYRLEEEGVYVP